METYDKQAAYQAVIARIRETVQLPPNRAPQSWLAEQLGVSRQLVYVWDTKGIPEGYAEAIAKLLDMEPAQVCPSLVTSYLPEPVFNAIVQRTTPKKPFHVKIVELIRLGLNRENKETEVRRSERIKATLPEQPMKPVGGFIPISAEELENQREEAIKAGADLSVRGRRK